MNKCPITYETCDSTYSKKGLHSLSPKLQSLHDLPYTAKEQIETAVKLASKLSIQGVQPKLSATLNVAKGTFEITEKGGTYIIKPPHLVYNELPQNEDLTMKLADLVGIEVPMHGMVYNADKTLSYFIKRFDRYGKNKKLAVEDFSQLLGFSRDTKYDSSMEKLITVLEKHCTFPVLEKMKLFRLTLFNYLIGNEDMHLKNFSLIRREEKVELSPAYDLLNSAIVTASGEQIALTLRGKKSNLKKEDLIHYFGEERLRLPHKLIQEIMDKLQSVKAEIERLIELSFLSDEMKEKYLRCLLVNWKTIFN